ncbi:hypothetical protein F5X96DRAFT_539983 [Biscogniauxia mediterranea]|nr:hypothetical protein F5X96DRAFT_539983 [Biscogniauxia mediterranea]
MSLSTPGSIRPAHSSSSSSDGGVLQVGGLILRDAHSPPFFLPLSSLPCHSNPLSCPILCWHILLSGVLGMFLIAFLLSSSNRCIPIFFLELSFFSFFFGLAQSSWHTPLVSRAFSFPPGAFLGGFVATKAEMGTPASQPLGRPQRERER